jgi:CheY-like chemotaxis protein
MSRILVIDDDRQLRDVMSRALRRAGHTVVEADNGNAGIRSYREHGADLVITDLFMPERDGLETILQLRRESPGVKIVAVSGGDRTGRIDLREGARLFGALRTLEKPFGPNELVNVVTELLDESQPGSPTRES